MDHRPAARSSWRFTRDVVDGARRDGLFDVAAGVAFWLLLSLPAALLAVVSFTSLLGERVTGEVERTVVELIGTVLSSESDALTSRIEGMFDRPRTGLFSASLAVAVFTLSRGFAGLIRSLDTAYGVADGRSFVRVRGLAVLMAIGTLVTVAAATLAWVGLRQLGIPNGVGAVAAVVLLVLWAATLFHVGPHHHTPWRYDLPGAVMTAIGWFGMSVAYGWYVGVAGGQVVGAIGAALLGLTWLWLVCVVFLLGAEVNAVLARRHGVVQRPSTVTDRVLAAGRRRYEQRSRRRDGTTTREPSQARR